VTVFARQIVSWELKCETSFKEFVMTDDQMRAQENVRAAAVAAETTGLTEAEICEAAVNGLIHPEMKGGRPPGNYNPIADCLDKPKGANDRAS
jgi:hypothetical protein